MKKAAQNKERNEKERGARKFPERFRCEERKKMEASQLSIDTMHLLVRFMSAVKDDPRITKGHISIYTSLLCLWQLKGTGKPLSFFSYEVRPLCKISGTAAYHKNIKELHQYGYIHYHTSYNHFKGSRVSFPATFIPFTYL